MSARAYRIGVGSAPGFQHWRAYRNNQDAAVVVQSEQGIIGVVTDGCSQGAHSEVGAQLMARFIAQRAMQMLRCSEADQLWRLQQPLDRRLFLAALQGAAEQYLDTLIEGLAGDKIASIQSLFLFTVLGVVITSSISFVFGLGDGVYQLNGNYFAIDQDNKPLYLGYRLLPEGVLTLDKAMLRFREYRYIATEQLRSVILGSDGADIFRLRAEEYLKSNDIVGSLDQFRNITRFTQQANAINKRLNVVNLLNRKGHDDTTLIVIRREDDSHEQAD